MSEKVYGPYKRKDGRQHVIIVTKSDGMVSRRTVSYPKYLVESKSNTTIGDLTVDHHDRDFSNNDSTNLRTLPRKEHSELDVNRTYIPDVECVGCSRMFSPTRNQVNKRAELAAGPFCSRRCCGLYGSSVGHGGKKIHRSKITKINYRLCKI